MIGHWGWSCALVIHSRIDEFGDWVAVVLLGVHYLFVYLAVRWRDEFKVQRWRFGEHHAVGSIRFGIVGFDAETVPANNGEASVVIYVISFLMYLLSVQLHFCHIVDFRFGRNLVVKHEIGESL